MGIDNGAIATTRLLEPHEQQHALASLGPDARNPSAVRAIATSEGDVRVRRAFLSGPPGTGKSEVPVHAAKRIVDRGCRVLFLAPTGADFEICTLQVKKFIMQNDEFGSLFSYEILLAVRPLSEGPWPPDPS